MYISFRVDWFCSGINFIMYFPMLQKVPGVLHPGWECVAQIFGTITVLQ